MDAEPTHSNAQPVLSGASQSARRSTPYDANTGVKFQPAAKAGTVGSVVLRPACRCANSLLYLVDTAARRLDSAPGFAMDES
jgi:hypothetical protein